MSDLAQWIGGNWGWVIVIFSVFFEVAPVKIHPVSTILGWVGKRLNGGLKKDIDGIKADIDVFKRETEENFMKVDKRQDEAEKESDLQRMAGIKNAVLEFANSCMNGRKHTKEEFDHLMSENAIYEALVAKHHISNEVYSESYNYIKRVYRKCLDERKFLIGTDV